MLGYKLQIGRWAPALLAAILLLGLVHSARAQETSGDGWVLTGPGGPVSKLFAPASGALFAWGKTGLSRSDDAGATWRQVSLPDAADLVEVDPTDHTILYATGTEGIYKSGDDAASWTLVLPTAEDVRTIAVSPADHHLVYAGLAGPGSYSTDFRFLRTRDGGATWEQLEQYHNSLCAWSVVLFRPHPTDGNQAFRTAGCYAGRNIGDELKLSTDQGTTWSNLFQPRGAFPVRLVGGQGGAAGRFYLASNQDPRSGGSSVFRSDDDGRIWSEVLAYRGGGTMVQLNDPDVTIGGLAYDPAAPDRVYVGLNTGKSGGNPTSGRVQTSADGGTTWTPLGDHDPGVIGDLVLGIDGRNLFVATDQGVWRVAIAAPTA